MNRTLSTVLVVTLLMLSIGACSVGNTFQIAVIGPLSGKDSDGGQAMLDGVNLRVKQINERGGVHGRKLKVLAYDDQNSKQIARKKAIEIARNSNVLAVIGHYYSSTSVEGGKIYKQYGIPSVTATATAPGVTAGCDALCIAPRAAICGADEPWRDSAVDSNFIKRESRQPVTGYRVSRSDRLYLFRHLRPHSVRDCHLCRSAYGEPKE